MQRRFNIGIGLRRRSQHQTAAVSAEQLRGMTVLGTFVLVFGFILAAIATLSAPDANAAFSRPAPIIAGTLLLSFLIELQGGLRNVVRLDLFMLFVLYLLTFLEFLFPQDDISFRVSMDAAKTSASGTILAFAGISIGRLFFLPRTSFSDSTNLSVSPAFIFNTLLVCTFFGYLYMLLAVNFDIREMIHQIMRPRFSQPWSRGMLGSFSTLLNEVGMLKFLIAPLVGAIFAQAKRYSWIQIVVGATLLGFVLFESFASGTRNVFLSHIMTFGAAYTLLMHKPSIFKALKIWIPLLAISIFSINYLLAVRTHGLSGMTQVEAPSVASSVSVDMNLLNIAALTEVFPERHPYLGLEIPMTALIRPIPRALWSGKPEGLSMSIEDAVGAGPSMTISATFVGEFYMAGGFSSIAIAALFLGVIAGWWNTVNARASSTMQIILFATAFFPAGIAMRSFMSATPAILPVIGLAVIIYLFGSNRKRSRRKLALKS